jgi:hypothetical protein
MARQAIPSTYRGSFLSKFVGLCALALFLLMAIRHPAETVYCVRGAYHLAVGAADAISKFLRAIGS